MKRVIALILLLLGASIAHAQDFTGGLTIAVSPQYPAPDQTVHLTLTSSLASLEDTVVTWRSGRVQIDSGAGLTAIDMKAPAAGERATITATAGNDETSITLAPASLSLMWESDAFTPGLYRGRSMPSSGSGVTFVAIPHMSTAGHEIASSQLRFTWQLNGQTLSALSGRGKDSITVAMPTLSDHMTVSVTAQSTDLQTAQLTTTVNTADPLVRLYVNHPLYGVLYHSALTAASAFRDTETTFSAIPFNVSASGPNDRNFGYSWSVNGVDVEPNPTQPNTVTINAGKGGTANIDLSVTNKENVLYDAVGKWVVSFGSAGSAFSGPDPFTGK